MYNLSSKQLHYQLYMYASVMNLKNNNLQHHKPFSN